MLLLRQFIARSKARTLLLLFLLLLALILILPSLDSVPIRVGFVVTMLRVVSHDALLSLLFERSWLNQGGMQRQFAGLGSRSILHNAPR
jgi:hypothetical protein